MKVTYADVAASRNATLNQKNQKTVRQKFKSALRYVRKNGYKQCRRSWWCSRIP